MANHDIVARVGAVISMMAAVWNMFVSFVWIITLIWFLVGAMWFIPLILAALQIVGAVAVLVVGQHKATPLVPVVGLFVSVCNFNFLAGALEVIALMCQGIAWYLQTQAEQDVMSGTPAMAV